MEAAECNDGIGGRCPTIAAALLCGTEQLSFWCLRLMIISLYGKSIYLPVTVSSVYSYASTIVSNYGTSEP